MTTTTKGAYLKGPSRPRVPGVIFTIEVQTHNETVSRRCGTVARTFRSAHITVSRLNRGVWSAPEVEECDTPEDALTWMAERASARRTNWVVAPVASDALTLLRWWGWAERQGVVWRQERITSPIGARPGDEREAVAFSRLVVRGTPDIIRYHHRGVCWQWVSGHQYLPEGPGTMGAPPPGEIEHVRTEAGRRPMCERWSGREAMRWSRALRRMCNWWAEHAAAPWGATVGQCGVSILRTHAPRKVLSSHRCDDSAQLERQASFGGRASCWYVGAVGRGVTVTGVPDRETGERREWRTEGPVTQIDMRSMYPTLLRDQPFPVKLHSHRLKMCVEEAVELSRDWGVIAHVTLLARHAEYPVRRGARVYFPTGQIHTTLTGPELIAASESDRIETIHRASVYRLHWPFRGACSALLALRAAARQSGDSSGEQWAKLLANSLGGKLAQRSGQWVRSPDRDVPGQWGASHSINADAGTLTRFRHIAGVCWRYEDDERAAGPYAAAFAYLTAYGRLAMRRLRELCPPRSVVSQDTDGLWVLPHGLRALRRSDVAWGDGPGELREVCSAADARWIGPRHYYAGGCWTLAGFSGATVDPVNLSVWDTVRDSLWGSTLDHAPCELRERARKSALRSDTRQGVVGADGWVVPFRADALPE